MSLSRLELSAVTLLVRLTFCLQSVLDISRASLHLWSDSTVALGWIKGPLSRWQTYVVNRVSEIQTTVLDAQWHHIPGRENPADCASRGLSPSELVDHELWWQGPSWLKKNSLDWPTVAGPMDEEMLPEKRAKVHATGATSKEPEELLRSLPSADCYASPRGVDIGFSERRKKSELPLILILCSESSFPRPSSTTLDCCRFD